MSSRPARAVLTLAMLVLCAGCVRQAELPDDPGDILPRGVYGQTPDAPAPGPRLPARLAVFVNRPERGLYYMYVNDRALFGKDVNGAQDAKDDAFDLLMTNRPALEWAFQREAGAAIDEVDVEGVVRGELSRGVLDRLARESGADLVLVIRRIFNVNAKGEVPPSVALGPEGIFMSPVEGSLDAQSVAMETQAVLYDAAGLRLYPLTADLRFADLTTTDTTEERRGLLEDMANKSLLEIAGQVADKLGEARYAATSGTSSEGQR